jgi:hypothetical protein
MKVFDWDAAKRPDVDVLMSLFGSDEVPTIACWGDGQAESNAVMAWVAQADQSLKQSITERLQMRNEYVDGLKKKADENERVRKAQAVRAANFNAPDDEIVFGEAQTRVKVDDFVTFYEAAGDEDF